MQAENLKYQNIKRLEKDGEIVRLEQEIADIENEIAKQDVEFQQMVEEEDEEIAKQVAKLEQLNEEKIAFYHSKIAKQ